MVYEIVITNTSGPVQFRVYRDADDGSDTLDADARLLGIRVHYGKA